jgi:acetate kinase
VRILVANIGSTSFKYQLFDPVSGQVLGKGRVERIGQPGGDCPDYSTAIARCLTALTGPGGPLSSLDDLTAVGFKAVHAGPKGGLCLVDEEVLAAMEQYSFLAPAHNPPYLAAMKAFRQLASGLPLVALFETAFFTLSEAARTYALPLEWRDRLGVQRYGFHGASHRHASERAAFLLDRPRLRQISCHLGGSSSVAAIRDGAGIDCSFGMSPQSGLPHNNRVGEVDVFAILYVMRELGLDINETARILSEQSGLAGISGIGGDLRDLKEAAGNPRARLAQDVLVYWIRHYLGAFLVQLGGLDVITFSGGIGENSPEIRSAVCQEMDDFGLSLDDTANYQATGERDIARPDSKVRVLVVPADEEWIVARYAGELIEESGATAPSRE